MLKAPFLPIRDLVIFPNVVTPIYVGRANSIATFFPLTLFSLGGMMLFPLSSNLIALFVMLELVSLPLYIMAAMARHRRLLSQEAALKYFVLGAFASAFLLMGAALLYGFSGSVSYTDIAG